MFDTLLMGYFVSTFVRSPAYIHDYMFEKCRNNLDALGMIVKVGIASSLLMPVVCDVLPQWLLSMNTQPFVLFSHINAIFFILIWLAFVAMGRYWDYFRIMSSSSRLIRAELIALAAAVMVIIGVAYGKKSSKENY